MVLGNASAKTRIIEETLNPQWDQTLILDCILLPGDPDRVWEMLPEIVIEIFDYDEIVRFQLQVPLQSHSPLLACRCCGLVRRLKLLVLVLVLVRRPRACGARRARTTTSDA